MMMTKSSSLECREGGAEQDSSSGGYNHLLRPFFKFTQRE